MPIENTTLLTEKCRVQLRELGEFIDQQQRRLAAELWEMRKEKQKVNKAIRQSLDNYVAANGHADWKPV